MSEDKKSHMFDYPPFSQGRMARILYVHEVAYRYRRLPKIKQNKESLYAVIKECDLDGSETGSFLNIVRNYTTKEIRRYLLENGSKIVRKGKRTRPVKIEIKESKE